MERTESGLVPSVLQSDPTAARQTHVARYFFSLGSEWQPRRLAGSRVFTQLPFFICHQHGRQRERELDQFLSGFLYLSIWQMIAALRRIRHVTGRSHFRSRGSGVASKASYESRDGTCDAGCRISSVGLFSDEQSKERLRCEVQRYMEQSSGPLTVRLWQVVAGSREIWHRHIWLLELYPSGS